MAHSAIYDPRRNRMVLFGGQASQYFGDVWELSLGSTPHWNPLSPSGPSPVARAQHAAVHDPVRDRMIVFGGGVPTSEIVVSDLWSLSLGGSPLWSPLSPTGLMPDGRRKGRAIYDSGNDRMVFFGGINAVGYQSDVWSLTWGTPLAVDPTPTSGRVSLAAGFPNPAREAFSISFAQPSAGPVSLKIYDMAGRLIRTLRDGPLAAGVHTLRWDTRGDGGARVPPGVYFYELRSNGERQSRRVAVME